MTATCDPQLHKQQFDQHICALIQNKRRDHNKHFLTMDRYESLVDRIKDVKSRRKREPCEYRLLQQVDVVVIGAREKLIKPIKDVNSPILFYVTTDELFDVLHETHLNIGHGGRNRMSTELKKKYCNITKETIMAYLILCKYCQKKRATMSTNILNQKQNTALKDDDEHLEMYQEDLFSLVKAEYNEDSSSPPEDLPSTGNLPVFESANSPVSIYTEGNGKFYVNPQQQQQQSQQQQQEESDSDFGSASKRLKLSTDPAMLINRQQENEFDLFGRSIAIQLNNMPLNRALICQEKLQAVIKEERLFQWSNEQSSSTVMSSTSS